MAETGANREEGILREDFISIKLAFLSLGYYNWCKRDLLYKRVSSITHFSKEIHDDSAQD